MLDFDIGVTEAGLDRQVALVTGAGRGLGRFIAQGLAAAGARVACGARSVDQLAETVRLIEAAGGTAISITADVTRQSDVERLVEETTGRLGPIDLLVNNAGIGTQANLELRPEEPFWEFDPAEWWHIWEVNLRGTYLCSRFVLPGMVARKRGRIINMASNTGVHPRDSASPYAASKTAVIVFTQGLARVTKPHGIAVFAIAPGRVRTMWAEKLWQLQHDRQLPIPPPSPYSDWSPPELPARLVVYLATGKADAISGRYIHARADDVGAMVERAADIEREDLFTFRFQKFPSER